MRRQWATTVTPPPFHQVRTAKMAPGDLSSLLTFLERMGRQGGYAGCVGTGAAGGFGAPEAPALGVTAIQRY
jgi:hypothetical protein